MTDSGETLKASHEQGARVSIGAASWNEPIAAPVAFRRGFEVMRFLERFGGSQELPRARERVTAHFHRIFS